MRLVMRDLICLTELDGMKAAVYSETAATTSSMWTRRCILITLSVCPKTRALRAAETYPWRVDTQLASGSLAQRGEGLLAHNRAWQRGCYRDEKKDKRQTEEKR
ncbi:MAG TPA: hypothetical protein DCR55_02375 [Lentisphaeria bacterium]|nr:hypothetical protein [Lentisphaeria bacterium]